MRACVYTRTHTHTQAHTHTHTHTHFVSHTFTYIHTCTHVHILFSGTREEKKTDTHHACAHASTHAYTHTQEHTHTLTHTRARMHARTHTHTYTHLHTRTHRRTHAHAPCQNGRPVGDMPTTRQPQASVLTDGDSGDEEAFRKPGRLAVHVRLRADREADFPLAPVNRKIVSRYVSLLTKSSIL